MHRLLNGIRGLHNMVQPKRNSIIGIDISSTAVAILALSEKDKVLCVDCYGREFLSPNALGTIDAVPNTIKKLLHQVHPQYKRVAVALPDAVVITKIIQVNAYLNEVEIEEYVYLEASKHIPYPLNEIYFDFTIMGASTKNSSLVDVLIVASRAEQVTSLVTLVNKAGLDVHIVDVASYAVARAIQHLSVDLPVESRDKTIALIQLNTQGINLFVMQKMELIYFRETPLSAAQLPTAFASLKEYLLIQIKHVLHFFCSLSPEHNVTHIVLAGDLAQVPGLAGIIQEQIRVTISIANPFSHMVCGEAVDRSALHQDAPELMIACGLALRNIA